MSPNCGAESGYLFQDNNKKKSFSFSKLEGHSVMHYRAQVCGKSACFKEQGCGHCALSIKNHSFYSAKVRNRKKT